MQAKASISSVIQYQLARIQSALSPPIQKGSLYTTTTQASAGTSYTKTSTERYFRRRQSFTEHEYSKNDNCLKGYYILVKSKCSGNAGLTIIASHSPKVSPLFSQFLLALYSNPCTSNPRPLFHHLPRYTGVFQEYQDNQPQCKCKWFGRL